MSKSKSLVFFGTERFSVPSLKCLIAEGYNVAAVVTKPDAKAGRGQQLQKPVVKLEAKKAGLKVLQPEKLADIKPELTGLDTGWAVLAAYGKIIPQAVLDIFPGGIVNVHPSLLPLWRGPSPVESTILHGDSKTGVSLMKLTAGMDEGPVYSQKELRLSGHEQRPELYKLLADMGARLLSQKLPEIISGSLDPTPQDDSKATYSRLLKKEDGWTDWDEPAEAIERKVRAFLDFPKTRAIVCGHEVVITKARLAENEEAGPLVMRCQPGWLEIQELTAPSGRTVSGADFLRGYKK